MTPDVPTDTDRLSALPRPQPRKKKLSREEKGQLTLRNLLEAAATIVGEHGYAATTIANVTREAGVAHGTFYNYFEDRQALFDVLLPYVGERMTDYITASLAGVGGGLEREVARFRAYCGYLRVNPGFYRILYEAEVFAPKAFDAHIERLTEGYVRAFRRAIAAGDCYEMGDEELRAIAGILLGARAYVAMQFKDTGVIPETAIAAYESLMKQGLFKAK